MPEKASGSTLAEFRLRGEDRMGEPGLGKEAGGVWLSIEGLCLLSVNTLP